MDGPLQLILDTGVSIRREMLTMGVTDQELRASIRQGVLRRICPGAYTSPERWDTASDVVRHELMCVAACRVFGDRVALSHTSSLVMQGIPVWGADLRRVHLTRLDGGAARSEGGVTHHEAVLPAADLLVLTDSGLQATNPARAVIEHASLNTVESGLVSADAALKALRVTPEELADVFTRMARWPGTQRVDLVVRLADGRAGSPGETRARYLCWRHSLPAPELQFEVHDETGSLIGITDFAWPHHRLLGEFDGQMTYGRQLKPGQTLADVVFAEKRREHRLREVTGWSMIRIAWEDLRLGAYTAQRIRNMLLRAA